jgi:hypothetical protein
MAGMNAPAINPNMAHGGMGMMNNPMGMMNMGGMNGMSGMAPGMGMGGAYLIEARENYSPDYSRLWRSWHGYE